MQRSQFITLFIGIHILFVLLLIAKQSQFTKLSYQKQKQERQLRKFAQRKDMLRRQLHLCTSPAHIAHRAQSTLDMQPLRLGNIRRIPT